MSDKVYYPLKQRDLSFFFASAELVMNCLGAIADGAGPKNRAKAKELIEAYRHGSDL